MPHGQRLYAPWYVNDDSPFARAHAEAIAGGPMIVAPDRCYILHAFASRPIAGDVLEAGVYQGGTAQLLAATMAGTGRTLHLFDTFEGMPDTAIPDRDSHSPGDFAEGTLEFVRTRLATYPDVVFHPGFVPDTFIELEADARFASHVDLDIYPSVRDACVGLWPRLVPGGVMIFDDYGFRNLRQAARRARRRILRRHSGQADRAAHRAGDRAQERLATEAVRTATPAPGRWAPSPWGRSW